MNYEQSTDEEAEDDCEQGQNYGKEVEEDEEKEVLSKM